MSVFKVTPTHRRTKNTAPYFFVEARSEKEAVKTATTHSRLLEEPKEWKAVIIERKTKGSSRRKKKPSRNRIKSAT